MYSLWIQRLIWFEFCFIPSFFGWLKSIQLYNILFIRACNIGTIRFRKLYLNVILLAYYMSLSYLTFIFRNLRHRAGWGARLWRSLGFCGRSDGNHGRSKTKFRGLYSASELYRPSDRRLSAKLVSTFADRWCRVISATDPRSLIRFSWPEPLLFHSVTLTRLSGPRSRPTTSQKIW
jgi:hypothetical protein